MIYALIQAVCATALIATVAASSGIVAGILTAVACVSSFFGGRIYQEERR